MMESYLFLFEKENVQPSILFNNNIKSHPTYSLDQESIPAPV